MAHAISKPTPTVTADMNAKISRTLKVILDNVCGSSIDNLWSIAEAELGNPTPSQNPWNCGYYWQLAEWTIKYHEYAQCNHEAMGDPMDAAGIVGQIRMLPKALKALKDAESELCDAMRMVLMESLEAA